MQVIRNKKYQKMANGEISLWNKSASEELLKMPPDYSSYRNTYPYKIYRNRFVEKMLNNIHEGDKILELGCYNGWFTLEMARRGANIDAHDISDKAIQIAKNYYFQRKKNEEIRGSISYFASDLNFPKFPTNAYDIVVVRNVLHHLINLDFLFKEILKTLKNGGKILVDDAIPSGKKEAIISGILLFLLPTDIPYNEKISRVFKKGQILKRTQGLIDACGASPFEGISKDESIKLLKRNFKIINFTRFASFVGTVTAHLKINNTFKYLVLVILNFLDELSTNIGLFKGTGYYLEGLKD